jgi:hypothetical protein
MIRSITSYGDRPNDLLNVTHYFKAHFQQVHKKGNDLFKKNVPAYSRELYTHMTSVVVRVDLWFLSFDDADSARA